MTEEPVRRRKKKAKRDEHLVRTFCALTLDPETTAILREALNKTHHSLSRSFSWVRPESWHITIKFFGDVPQSELSRISDSLKVIAASTGPVPVDLRAVGAFPDMRTPKLLWTGVQELGKARRLEGLYRDVNLSAKRMGYAEETRRFKPHVTLARAKGSTHYPVARELTPLMDTAFHSTVLRKLVLFKSVRGQDGAEYTPLFIHPLSES